MSDGVGYGNRRCVLYRVWHGVAWSAYFGSSEILMRLILRDGKYYLDISLTSPEENAPRRRQVTILERNSRLCRFALNKFSFTLKSSVQIWSQRTVLQFGQGVIIDKHENMPQGFALYTRMGIISKRIAFDPINAFAFTYSTTRVFLTIAFPFDTSIISAQTPRSHQLLAIASVPTVLDTHSAIISTY